MSYGHQPEITIRSAEGFVKHPPGYFFEQGGGRFCGGAKVGDPQTWRGRGWHENCNIGIWNRLRAPLAGGGKDFPPAARRVSPWAILLTPIDPVPLPDTVERPVKRRGLAMVFKLTRQRFPRRWRATNPMGAGLDQTGPTLFSRIWPTEIADFF